MSRYSGHDGYTYPGSGVLRNRFGIVDPALLRAKEANLVAARSRELSVSPLAGGFDLKHLQAIHRHLFGDLYEWAGQLRTVDISKNEARFAHHAFIASAASEVFAKLKQENHLAGLKLEVFCSRAAYYLAEINALHPFRDGNGRAQREFLSHLADANGYYIAWENMAFEELLEASVHSFRGDLSWLTATLLANTDPIPL